MVSGVYRMIKSALSFGILAECPVSKARVSKMALPHQEVDTPVFMPVGTQGTLKGVTSQQLVDMDCQIILGNTYHLGNKPVSERSGHLLWYVLVFCVVVLNDAHQGCDVLKQAGGLHEFMGWNRALLTVSEFTCNHGP